MKTKLNKKMVNVYFLRKKLFSAVMVALAVMTMWGGDALASQSVRVPFVFAGQSEWGQYYYGDYETKGAEPTRTDWWGTVEYSLENEATSPDAAGTFIALDDADDLSWEYYSDNTLPVHTNGAVNVVIKYYGCGWNLVDNVEVTDLGISPVVAGDGGDNVKAIFYQKTLEKENEGDTYYNYITIPNPFSRRPVREGVTTQTGANCKYLGFYAWAVEYSGCSLTYADGSNFTSEGGFDNIVYPDRKLKITNVGSNPIITFRALWNQAYVVLDNTPVAGQTTAYNDYLNSSSLYERQFLVLGDTKTSLTQPSKPVTCSQLYPDGTDAGGYDSNPTEVKFSSNSTAETIDCKIEYMNIKSDSDLKKLPGNTHTDKFNFRRFVIGRGVKMQSAVAFNGLSNNGTSNYNMAFGIGCDVRIESGLYTNVIALNSTYASYDGGYWDMQSNVAGATNLFTLGCDYDRWAQDNTKLNVSGNINLTKRVAFRVGGANTPAFSIKIKSGTFGSSSSNYIHFGNDLLNNSVKTKTTGTQESSSYNLGIYSSRIIEFEGGWVKSSIFGGGDENVKSAYNSTNATYISFSGAGCAVKNGSFVDVSSLYCTFKMKGGILDGDFYGGDNVDFTQSGTTRFEITAQPRRLMFIGGTINGNIYGGSRYNDASSATTLTDETHMSALALSDVNMYIGGGLDLNSSTDVYGGDNNTANTSVKTLHSVRNVNMVIAEGISVNEVYGGGNGAGLGKNYAVDPSSTSSDILSDDPKSNVSISLRGITASNVYGGIKGDSYADQIIGSSNITINGGTYTNVYGGGNGTYTEIKGSTSVTLNSGNVSGCVYGGGNQGNVGEFISDVAAVNINGGTVSGSVYGGGFQGYSYSSPAVNIKGGSVGGNVYGGANGGASYQDEVYTKGLRTVNVADNANVSGNVYGGSLNCNDQLNGIEKGYSGTTSKYGQAPIWVTNNQYTEQFKLSSAQMGGPKTISAITFDVFWNGLTSSNSATRILYIYMQELDVANDDYYYDGVSSATPYTSLVQPSSSNNVVNGQSKTIAYGQQSLTIDFDTPFVYSGTKAVAVTIISMGGSNVGSLSTISGGDQMSSLTTGSNKLLWNSYNTQYCQFIYCKATTTSSNFTIAKLIDDQKITSSESYSANGSSKVNFAQNAVPSVSFTYTVEEQYTNKIQTAFVNVTKGSVGGSVYGSGNNNKMYGGCYVNIGKNAVENAPGHEANVNALETLTAGSIAISGSVYAGSNGTGSWAYTADNRSISGVSNVYLDGSGYSSNAITIGGSKGATAGNIYGCSTNGEGGKLGSNVFISNIGARNAEGKAMKSTTWGLNSVQHTDTLVLNNAHVTFNGAQQIEGSTNNSIYGIHKIMRVVNNSTALLKADADSIAKVGSYHCDDVYADEPVYTEVTAVEGATSKTQLTDCKNTVVFANGSNLYMRSMESGTETYGELNGYLYAVNTDSENTASARARQKNTYNSPVTGGYNDDGGFVSYDDTFNTYDNPPIDNYSGVGGKQEIAFTNISTTYRVWDIVASQEPNLWTEFVTERPSTFPTDEVITTGGSSYVIPLTCENDLAWFISYVNGFNGCVAHPSAKAKLTADVNMNEYVWVPIGINNSTKFFSGSFDGQCYTIDGIHIASDEIGFVEISSEGTSGDMQYTGMFGYTTGATIKNTFVTSGSLACDGENGYLGGLVGYANSTNIEFCESALALATAGSLSAVGGIAGQASGSTIKAVMAVGDITINDDVYNAGCVTGTDGEVTTFYANQTISATGTVPTQSTSGINGYTRTSDDDYSMGILNFTDATPYTYGSYSINNTVKDANGNDVPLVDSLNKNVADGYKWMRSTSQAINGDYPIIVKAANDGMAIVNANTTDNKVVRYGDINELLGMEKYQNAAYSVYMYNSGELSVAPAGTKLYIDENVSMKQSTNNPITATVGITLDNSNGTAEMHRDWHMFSASIAAGKTGLEYILEPTTYPTSGNDLTFGTGYYLIQDDNSVYFPNGITTDEGCDGKEFDIYSFYEPQYHWMNLKRNTHHWHQDNQNPIEYTSEKTFTPGMGYLVAIGNNTNANNNLMQAEGVLNNGPVSANVSNIGEHLTGYNLLGNPYQSYLDFEAFVGYGSNATNLWKDDTVGTKAFLIYDADRKGFVEYLADDGGVTFSQNADEVTNQYIHPHQAFFVVKNTETQGTAEVRFDNTMRNLNSTAPFRDEAPAYPLVNLRCTDSNGKWEHSVIELERPLAAGSLKMKELLSGKGSMYIHWADNDYRSVFIDHMPDYVPVWFEAVENGVFTMTWNTANAPFGYMHLIDNITGTDFDCLAPGNDHYTFEAKTTDMAARFRLVFKPLGIEEETTEKGENFAFFNGEQLIVNGVGDLQLIDVNGRILMTKHLSGEQNSISLPNVAAGMYMLRLNSDSEPKIQKIVVRK